MLQKIQMVDMSIMDGVVWLRNNVLRDSHDSDLGLSGCAK